MQNLIVYQFNTLFQILKELEENLNFKIVDAKNENSLKEKINISKKYIIITKKKLLDQNNQIIIEKFPIKFNKLIEKLNIQSLKQQFNDQSEINIKNYLIDLNSREISLNDIRLKLTEKEINTIIYLSNQKKPISIQELQIKVWGYQSGMETHTVETHIYRLRKKILKTFNDENLLLSKKNGYQIS